jgi:hypothetical protein
MTHNIYSNRSLQLTYGEVGYHNPCFLHGDWCWHADFTFGVWVYRAVTKAKEANALTQKMMSAYEDIRQHLRDHYGDACDRIPAAAKSPVSLPPIPSEWFSLTFCSIMGLTSNPPWPTFEADRVKFDAQTRDIPKPVTAIAAIDQAVQTTTKTDDDEKTTTTTDQQPRPEAIATVAAA